MIKSYSEERIVFEKTLNKLDRFVLGIIDLLEDIKYVVVSGYVVIFFGRTRATESVDFFIEEINFNKFKKLAERIGQKGYWFVNGGNLKTLYELLKEGSSLRIAKKDGWMPNAEIKFPSNKTDRFSLINRIKVMFGNNVLYISPIELQIAYKIKLGGNKDLEDAMHLFKLLKKYLSKKELAYFIELLRAEVPEWLEGFLKK